MWHLSGPIKMLWCMLTPTLVAIDISFLNCICCQCKFYKIQHMCAYIRYKDNTIIINMATKKSAAKLMQMNIVIWKIFGSKIFSDAQLLLKFIYLKILQYEYLVHEHLRDVISLKHALCLLYWPLSFICCLYYDVD